MNLHRFHMTFKNKLCTYETGFYIDSDFIRDF
jgi:hypothetical protein